MTKFTYKNSGVDISKGERAVSDVKAMIKSTFNENVLGNIGGFGGLYEIPQGYKKPVLVSSTDGVGTKLSVAVMAGKHDTVGEDLINHCINDIAVLGAKPLYFLDYFGTASLDETVFNNVIQGFVRGCLNSGVSLVGGETAEMPGIYHEKDYDLCGTIVGIIEKNNIINGAKIEAGDVLIGLQSNGLHTNGYSLARKVLFSEYKIDSYVQELGSTIAEELLRVHKCYFSEIQSSIDKFEIKGISHITGGGIVGNTSRILNENLKLNIDWECWEKQPVFNLIKNIGSVPENDMRRTFNLGVGLVLIVAKTEAQNILNFLSKTETQAWVIGDIS